MFIHGVLTINESSLLLVHIDGFHCSIAEYREIIGI